MDLDLDATSAGQRHRLMTTLVVPRPIAFITTRNEHGGINSAPFSFFNCMCADPPIVAVGTGYRGELTEKDTSCNITREKEFVVNLVDEGLVEAMNICAVDFGPDHEEHIAAQLELAPFQGLATPRLATAPVALGCKLFTIVAIAEGRKVHLGRVTHVYLRDDLVDGATLRVNPDRLGLVGRLHGPGWYTRTREKFQCRQLTLEEWNARLGGEASKVNS